MLDYRNADYVGINHFLVNQNWAEILKAGNINDMWINFVSKIKQVVDAYVPVRIRKTSNSKKHSPKVSRLLRKAYKLHKKFKKNNCDKTYQKYLVASRIAQTEKRNVDLNKESKILHAKSDPAFWGFLRSKLSYKSEIPCLLHENKIVVDNKAKADLFNDYFCSVFTKDDGNFPDWDIDPPTKFLSFVDFSPEEVYEQLKRQKNKFSSGPDGIPPFFLKKCALTLAFPLSILFNFAFANSVLPDQWILAHVKPIFKNKGSPSHCENYRPISLTCCCCKVMEAIFINSFRTFISNRIYSGQHGFYKGRSTETQLLECMSDWIMSLGQNKYVDVLYIDLQKAFDTVSSRKLINKLRCHGVVGLALSWVRALLYNRTQEVIIEDCKSYKANVFSGVPQGSNSGPDFFSVYINDIVNIFQKSKIKLFADDCKIYIASDVTDSPDVFQDEINSLMKWTKESQLNIAFSKCAILHLGTKNPLHKYYFGDIELSNVDSIRDLGVIMSNNLKFKEHLKHICSSATRTSNLIFKCFRSRNATFLIDLFKTYIRPKLEYCTTVWNPYNIEDIDLIERVQRRFVRRLKKGDKSNYKHRLRKYEIESLELRRLKADLIMTYKLLTNKLQVDSTQFFTLKSEVVLRNTRGHSKQIYAKAAKNKQTSNFFSNRVVNPWNSLPESLVISPTTNSFKSKLAKIDLSRFLRGTSLRN